MILCDPASERAVLAGICAYGEDAYLDTVDIIQESSFTIDSNGVIYKCIKNLFDNEHKSSVDVASIYASAQDIGLSNFFNKKEEAQHLRAILDFPVSLDNVRKFAAKIRKLEIGRLLRKQLEQAGDKLLEITGNESITSILGIAEDSIFNFSSLLNDSDNNPTNISKDIDDYIKGLEENKVDQIGIPTGFPVYDKAIGGGLRKGTINVIGARPKCQPLFSKILTPKGWITYKDIKKGDVISHPDGDTTVVVDVFETGYKDVYEFVFSDNSKTVACEEHRWKTKSRRWSSYETLSWQDMRTLSAGCRDFLYEQDRPKWQFPVTQPIYFEKKSNSMDPYLLGLLLSDGCITHSVGFSSADKFIVNKIRKIVKSKNYHIKKCDKYTYRIIRGIKGQKNIYKEELQKLGLYGKNSYKKFIPTDYIYTSIKDRIELLNGLMDGDGSSDFKGNVEYSTTSYKLAENIVELVRSLGGLAKFKKRKTKCNGKYFESYRLRVSFNDNSICFSLPRKKERCSKRIKPTIKRTLKEVKYIGKTQTRCIKVSAYDEMYITDDYIVTKNTGKTLLSDNMGKNIAALGIPVLNMDTEMNREDHINRLLAMMSEVEINNIETGKFSQSADIKNKILEAGEQLKQMKFYHKSIAGKPFEEQLAIMRRWLVKDVGLNDDGTAKDCVIFYDYLKLMDSAGISQDMKEYQVLGFMMTSLHNFAVRYKVPIMAFIQLNRDGITKESTDSASGSDRIIWLCSNFSIFKRKSDEEIAEDGSKNGNRKLIPVISRHGGGLDDNDYINCYMKGWCAKITEGKTKLEISNNKQDDEGFIVDEESDDDDEEILFN
jgi:replicative DNA helicase